MSTFTERSGVGSNQFAADYNTEKVFIFQNTFQDGETLLNNTGAELEAKKGLVLGRIADGGANNGKLAPLDPAATDGSQFVAGILNTTITLAIAAENTVSIGRSGEVNQNLVTFTGATTLDSIVALRMIKDLLADFGFTLRESTDMTHNDN